MLLKQKLATFIWKTFNKKFENEIQRNQIFLIYFEIPSPPTIYYQGGLLLQFFLLPKIKASKTRNRKKLKITKKKVNGLVGSET